MGKKKFQEYGPSETQEGQNTNVTNFHFRSSDYSVNYWIMYKCYKLLSSSDHCIKYWTVFKS